jgi:hypothetical protein
MITCWESGPKTLRQSSTRSSTSMRIWSLGSRFWSLSSFIWELPVCRYFHGTLQKSYMKTWFIASWTPQ